MGSITFNSLDGSSRVHDHILEDIGRLKRLDNNDNDVIFSLTRRAFRNFIWIDGPDRKYFATRLRSVLATEPVGEWSGRGMTDYTSDEALKWTFHCAQRGVRVPGLLSIAEHLESNDINPVVITHSVSANFPSFNFAPVALAAAIPDDAYDYATKFNRLSAKKQWKLVWPEFLRVHGESQWRPGPTAEAKVVQDLLLRCGMNDRCDEVSPLTDAFLAASTLDELEDLVEDNMTAIVEEAFETIAEDVPIYVAGHRFTFPMLAEKVAENNEHRLAGVASMQIMVNDWGQTMIGRYNVMTTNGTIEESSVPEATLVVVLPVFAIADELIEIIDKVSEVVQPTRVVIISGVANDLQASFAAYLLNDRPFKLDLFYVEAVNFNLLDVRQHFEKVFIKAPRGDHLDRQWMHDRSMAQIEKNMKADKVAKADRNTSLD